MRSTTLGLIWRWISFSFPFLVGPRISTITFTDRCIPVMSSCLQSFNSRRRMFFKTFLRFKDTQRHATIDEPIMGYKLMRWGEVSLFNLRDWRVTLPLSPKGAANICWSPLRGHRIRIHCWPVSSVDFQGLLYVEQEEENFFPVCKNWIR